MSELALDAFYDQTLPTALALSPDGDRLAFVADEFDPDEEERLSSLFVVPTDGSRDPHRLTRVPSASEPRWSPDGDRLAFLAARETDVADRVGRDAADDESDEGDGDDGADEDGETDEDANGDDEPKTQVWCYDLALGGDARRLTDREEGVSEFDWAPDGERLVVAARDPTEEEREYLDRREEGGPIETERLQHKLDGAGYLDTVTTYLFVVDAETGAETRLDDAYGGGAFQPLTGMEPRWSPDGERIAFTACRTANPDDTFVRDLYTVAPDGSDLREHTDSTLSVGNLSWSPDGDAIAFGGGDPENWCRPTELYLHDLGDGGGGEGGDGDERAEASGKGAEGAGEDGEGEEGDEGDGGEAAYRSLTADLDRTLSRFGSVEWADGALFTLVGDESRTRLVRVGTDGAVERTFEAQGDARALPRFDLAGDTFALQLSHPSEGVELFAVDAGEVDEDDPGSLRRLTALTREVLDAHEPPRVRRVTYESDGWDVDGVVYHPPAFDPDDPEPFPLVVAIHGGPISYDEPVYSFEHSALTSRGYVVFRPNYRGGSSYGRRFAEALRGRWGTVEVDDIAAGVEDLVERGWADPERVFGYGFSYGGIAQGYLVTQTDLLTAAAPEHGIYDLRSAYGTDDSHVWMEHEFGLPWENPDAVDASSAITDAGNIDTPLLVTAGGEDWRCPPGQSEQLYVAARKQGVDARLVIYPDEHHDVGDPDRAIHRLEQILDWYERHDPAVDSDGPEEAEDGN